MQTGWEPFPLLTLLLFAWLGCEIRILRRKIHDLQSRSAPQDRLSPEPGRRLHHRAFY